MENIIMIGKKLVLFIFSALLAHSVWAVDLDAPITVKLDSEGVTSHIVADFDINGYNDLIVTDAEGSINLYLGSAGKKLFKEVINISFIGVGGGPVHVLHSNDFNNDGLPDLVTSSPICDNSNKKFPVMLSESEGKFSLATCLLRDVSTTYTDTYIKSIASSDFNDDNNVDIVIAVTGNYGSKVLLLYLGNGDGTFSDMVTVYDATDTGARPRKMITGDFDSDGYSDILLNTGSDSISNSSTLYSGDGNGNFVESDWTEAWPNQNPYANDPVQLLVDTWDTYYPVAAHVVDDFNNDGLVDVVTLTERVGSNAKALVYFQSNGDVVTDPVPDTGGEEDTAESDDEAPEVEINDPEEDLSGVVTINSSANDNVEVTSVEFYIDGDLVSTVSSPFSFTFNTVEYDNGEHTITATAFDAVGNTGSHSITVSISN